MVKRRAADYEGGLYAALDDDKDRTSFIAGYKGFRRDMTRKTGTKQRYKVRPEISLKSLRSMTSR